MEQKNNQETIKNALIIIICIIVLTLAFSIAIRMISKTADKSQNNTANQNQTPETISPNYVTKVIDGDTFEIYNNNR